MNTKDAIDDQVWRSPALADVYLSGVRGAIPFAKEQIEIAVRVARAAVGARQGVARVLDVGCGDGILGAAMRSACTQSEVVFVDFSTAMLEACRARNSAGPHHFVEADYGEPDWANAVAAWAPYDIVVSGYSIHHQPDVEKRRVYADIYRLLAPGGVFLNVEHVASRSAFVSGLNDDWFVDALFAARPDASMTREAVAEQYYHRPDKAANILSPVDDQCKWLRDIGFDDVDVFFKAFELAVFGGRRPTD